MFGQQMGTILRAGASFAQVSVVFICPLRAHCPVGFGLIQFDSVGLGPRRRRFVRMISQSCSMWILMVWCLAPVCWNHWESRGPLSNRIFGPQTSAAARQMAPGDQADIFTKSGKLAKPYRDQPAFRSATLHCDALAALVGNDCPASPAFFLECPRPPS